MIINAWTLLLAVYIVAFGAAMAILWALSKASPSEGGEA